VPRSCWAFEGHLSRIITLWPTLADRSYVQRIEVSEQQNGRSSIRFTYRVVAKRKTGVYREDRQDWLKVKNPTYSQAEGRHDLFRR